jgi:ribose transport system permease protein
MDRQLDGRRQRMTELLTTRGLGDRTGLRRAARAAAHSSFFWILVVLIALVCAFTVILPSGTFLTTFNAQTLAGDTSTLLILAAGATLVIVSGGLDLSIGSVMTFSAVISIVVMKEVGGPQLENGTAAAFGGLAAGLASGVAWGALNGILIARHRLPPFVVTLGTLGAALGAARLLSSGTSVGGAPPGLQEHVGLATVFGIPVPFLIALVAVALCGLLLAKTRYGEHNYLIGSNEEAARRGGINIPRHVFTLYVISGATAALAGQVEVARFSVASVSTGHTTELIAALAAVVIGGASLAGGVGAMSGTVIGVLIPVVLANGLLIGGIERFWQDIVVGAILIAAVWFDQWRRAHEAPGAE